MDEESGIRSRVEQQLPVSGAWLCHGTVRLTLAAEPFAFCEDLAEAWSVPSQLSSVVLTALMPCIIGISDGAVRFSSDVMMAVARRGADRSCGSIAVTRPRSLKMRARIRCSRLGPGRGTRMARFRKRRISLT